jgi:hypothetical protein
MPALASNGEATGFAPVASSVLSAVGTRSPLNRKEPVLGKYDALGVFLRRWAVRNTGDQVEMSFTQLESMIGALLPKAAMKEEWWSDGMNVRHAVQCRAWLDAGFEARLLSEERVIFCRFTKIPSCR